ncbi:cytochrome b [Pantanalinema sp. GBBB05]|uniref:cytochrome b n=1 Tax=Pantanalinema sp. GBBB05 TaxID=2604139 RepID=UPI001D8CFBEC|nr:cytochrome b [Pantanalinema sp. GBBB05]
MVNEVAKSNSRPSKTPKSKTFAQRLWSLHWWMAGIYLLLFVGGTYMATLQGDVTYRGSLYNFHKALGVLTMGLLTARILVLLLSLRWKPAAKRPLPKADRIWAIALHTILYLFMLVVPLSGWFFSNAYDKDVSFFGLLLPRLFSADQAVAELGRSLHFWLAYAFLAFIFLHTIDERKFFRAMLRRFSQSMRKTIVSKST